MVQTLFSTEQATLIRQLQNRNIGCQKEEILHVWNQTKFCKLLEKSLWAIEIYASFKSEDVFLHLHQFSFIKKNEYLLQCSTFLNLELYSMVNLSRDLFF